MGEVLCRFGLKIRKKNEAQSMMDIFCFFFLLFNAVNELNNYT